MIEFSFDIKNYGHGIALMVRTEAIDDYENPRGLNIFEGRYADLNIEDSSVASVRGHFIFTDEQRQDYNQPARDSRDLLNLKIVPSWKVHNLGTVAVTYFDVQGNSWKFSDDLVATLGGQDPSLSFINPVPSYPDQYIDPKRKRPWPRVGDAGSTSPRGENGGVS